MKIQDSIDKASFFFGTLPFNSWILLATCPSIGNPQKPQKINEVIAHFERKKLAIDSCGVGI